MYNSIILNSFVDAKNVGDLKGATTHGTFKSKQNGEVIKLSLKINENHIIEKATYKSFGGVVLSALSSVLCDLITDKSVAYAKKLSKHDIINVLKNIPQSQEYLAELNIKALNELIKKYSKKTGIKF